MAETQAESAQRMYSARAEKYEESWHPDYSKRFIKLVSIGPGDRLLDLCCGTGLEAFLAAELVGDSGEVVGVDITQDMLDRAAERQSREPELGRRIRLVHHDVTDLGGVGSSSGDAAAVPPLAPESFDAILCSNAFVLLDDPAAAVRHWRHYLRPGGLLVVDITHEHNLRAGVVMERVARRVGVGWPSNRGWVKSRDSFREVLEREGYDVERIEELSPKNLGNHSTFYTIEQADEQFDHMLKFTLSKPAMTDDLAARARTVFREEFARDAVDGKLEDVDLLYVYIARKPGQK